MPPASLQASLHVSPGQVTANDLRPGGDLVSLALGDDNAQVSVLGTLEQLTEVMVVALRGLAAVADARRDGT